MKNANYQLHEEREEAMEGKLGGPPWWPLFGVLGIPGGLLSWEALSPLPLIPAQAVSFAALGLVFCGIALWVIFFLNE